jgi:hypothetical protein
VLKDGEWHKVTAEDLAALETDCPEAAKYWQTPESINDIEVPAEAAGLAYENWQKAAKELVVRMWKFPHSWIFHKAVNPDELGIPDYFKVIKYPMDFGTIRQNLLDNEYTTL